MGELLHDVKKKRIFIAIILSIFGCVFTIYLYSNEQRMQRIRNELTIQFKSDKVIEYGTENFDMNSLILKHTGKLEKLPKLDTRKVGKVVLTFTISKHNVSKQFQRQIEIKDTKPPEIILNEVEIKVQQEETIDLKKYVKSVTDPVDGNLDYSEEEIHRNGYYFDKGSFDASKVGCYEIAVIAYDRNNNLAKNIIKIIIEPKAAAIGEPERIPNTNTSPGTPSPTVEEPVTKKNNGNLEEPSKPVQPSIPILCPGGRYPERACNVPISHPSVGSDGVYYDTFEDAKIIGDSLGWSGKISGYDCASVDLNDGQVKWIIVFY